MEMDQEKAKEENTDNRQRNLLIGVLIFIALIILGVLLLKYKLEGTESLVGKVIDNPEAAENRKIVNISEEDFNYIGLYTLENEVINTFCGEIKAGDCKAVSDYYNKNLLSECSKYGYEFKFNLATLPEEIKESNYSILNCDVYDDEKAILEKTSFMGSGYMKRLNIPIDVSKTSKIKICCQADSEEITSNSVCLNTITVNECK